VITTFCTAWMSVSPPVPPVKPINTEEGRLVPYVRTCAPSIVTLSPVAKVVTTKWCTTLRNEAIEELVVTYCNVPGPGPGPVAIPIRRAP
jgi:hypothetical protein